MNQLKSLPSYTVISCHIINNKNYLDLNNEMRNELQKTIEYEMATWFALQGKKYTFVKNKKKEGTNKGTPTKKDSDVTTLF